VGISNTIGSKVASADPSICLSS